MEQLLDAVTDVAMQLPPERVQSIADLIRKTEFHESITNLSAIVHTPVAKSLVGQMLRVWRMAGISADELSSMLISASHAFSRFNREQSVELVWTGPTTPFVSTRQTEQSLLQVIRAAQKNLFITSFVAYEISTVVEALNAATQRSVNISMLLESSQENGGSISHDAIATMKSLLPSAKIYAWTHKESIYARGRVHAKLAVADKNICFITSANLTDFAMERNMEAGILLAGGQIPSLLFDHLQALVYTKMVTLV